MKTEVPATGGRTIFLRRDVTYEDRGLYDEIEGAESNGDPMACEIMRKMDEMVRRLNAPPPRGELVLAARDCGWYEHDMPPNRADFTEFMRDPR